MESLTKQFPDKETFDKFFVENFKTMTYEDVKEGLEELVKAEGLNIFQDDYVKNVRKEDFKEHLSKGARFEFENAMTEAFYDKNRKYMRRHLDFTKKFQSRQWQLLRLFTARIRRYMKRV